MKTWEGGVHGKKPDWMMKFLSETDEELDKKLLKFDIKATEAHAEVLEEMGILTKEEVEMVKEELKKIDELEIEEDIHTSIENYLTEKLGETGKKIHSFRSRNDLVAMDMRLFML